MMGASFAMETGRSMADLGAQDTPITLDGHDARFKYRVVGVAVRDGKVLLHRREPDGFWCLPGGRARLMESSADTLRREMQEELGVPVEVQRLVWVVESFCRYHGRPHHTLALYFLIALPPDQSVPSEGEDDGVRVVFRWFPLAELGSVPLYPSFLRKALLDIPATPVHVVQAHGDLPLAGEQEQ